MLCLSSCVGVHQSITQRLETADNIAIKKNMAPFTFSGKYFDIFGYQRVGDVSQPIIIYIEGDGLNYLSFHKISPDPTPIDPLGLRFSAIDDSPNVIWLARPCQYVMSQYVIAEDITHRICHQDVWTVKRYHPHILHDYENLLIHIQQQYQQKNLHLVGYSGGGAIAALVAAKPKIKDNIISLRTIAGNLHNNALINYHQVSPMLESRDPIDIANDIRDIPQIHYVGRHDDVVLPFVAHDFKKRAANDQCVFVTENKKATHIRGWDSFWQRNYYLLPTC